MITDLPVAVALPAPLDTQVTLWVERDLGWQVVDHGGPLAAALALSDRPCGGLAWIAVVDGPADPHRTRALLEAGAADVVAWPDDRGRIPLVAVRLDVDRRRVPERRCLVVAGVAGGVGTSTVALAIGGLLAWRGARVLVTGTAALGQLAGVASEVVGAHHDVGGVPGLAVSAGGHAGAVWDGDLAVVDGGRLAAATTAAADVPNGRATVVVSRPDAGLRQARAAGCPVIVVGDRPLSAPQAARALGRPPLVHLPWSVRVARAGVTGRVPAALPGRWLRTLADGLRELEAVPA